MRKKETITKDNYLMVIYKRAIITCWVLLLIYLIIKICGGNFFDIVCHNQTFVDFCDKIDKSIVKYIIYYLTFVFASTMLLFITEPKIRIKSIKYLIFIIVITIIWVFKLVFDLNRIKISIAMFNGITVFVLYLTLALFSRKWYKAGAAVAYDFILTLVSVFIKNIGCKIITDSFLINTIFLIDYYILLTLTMLYSKKSLIKEE
jgi:hypothetical protein